MRAENTSNLRYRFSSDFQLQSYFSLCIFKMDVLSPNYCNISGTYHSLQLFAYLFSLVLSAYFLLIRSELQTQLHVSMYVQLDVQLNGEPHSEPHRVVD